MALVEKFHVVAAGHPVGSTDIDEGQLVKLNASGEVVPYDGSGVVIGVAGDTQSSSASAMPGVSAGWQNRASDSYDETAASSQITVYMAGGQFATDQFESDVESADPGAYLTGSANGKLTASGATAANAVAVLTVAAGAYPSGVPGTDINGDIALSGDNSNQYVEFILKV
jgi:hypothetical protein